MTGKTSLHQTQIIYNDRSLDFGVNPITFHLLFKKTKTRKIFRPSHLQTRNGTRWSSSDEEGVLIGALTRKASIEAGIRRNAICYKTKSLY